MYTRIKEAFSRVVEDNGLWNERVKVKAKVLRPDEAIGYPKRLDFPLFKGKERIVQAEFKGSYGQAFTEMYGDYEGTIIEILDLPLNNNHVRAILIATINAVMRYLNLIKTSIHCKDNGPELCSKDLIEYISSRYGNPRIAFIGYQPTHVECCSRHFEIRVLDLDRDNVGKVKFGLIIMDGEKEVDKVLDWCDLAIVTGSSFVNGTAPHIIDYMAGKPILFYGVTVVGIAELLNLNIFCSRSK